MQGYNTMPLELVTIPCLVDNYAYLIHDEATGQTALIDAPEAGPVLAALETREWVLNDILLTHHHDDHIQAVPALVAATGARVWGAAADAHRLPPLTHSLRDGDLVQIGSAQGRVLDVPGHTVGHIAYHFADDGLLFSGDSLMAGGCGRLFEGSADQMWASLTKCAALPAATRICSGHEYTLSNLRFALSVDSANPALAARMMRVIKARAENRPTVPSRLSGEIATNPFLRARDPDMKVGLGMDDASDAAVFAELRQRKDRF
jgi:hydroxyacylglutathione hydrolase